MPALLATPLMKAISQVKCLVFDFDGTLADTLKTIHQIYNKLAQQHGYRPLLEEDLPAARGMTMREFIRFSGVPRYRIPRLLRRGKVLMSNEMTHLAPVPGIPEVLQALRPVIPVLGILTSNAKENVESFLQVHNLGPFDFVSSVSKLTGKAKHLKGIRRTFSLDHSEIAYVGDETRDMRAAQKAGIPGIGVTWGFNNAQSLEAFKPALLIDAPHGLLRLLHASD